MARFASKTEVPVVRSIGDIELTLRRYGAEAFMYGYDETGSNIAFRHDGRLVKFFLPHPNPDDFPLHYKTEKQRRNRSEEQREKLIEEETKRRWRALLLVIKAKLEAIDSGITTFDKEFLSDLVLPDGRTVIEWAAPQIEKAVASGKMPKLIMSGD